MFKNSSPNNCQANKKRIWKKAQEKYQNHSKKKKKKSNNKAASVTKISHKQIFALKNWFKWKNAESYKLKLTRTN